MKKTATMLVTAATAWGLLAGCGGDDAYCVAVKDNQSALNVFGTKKTEATLTKEAKAVRSIATVAPDKTKKNWSTLAAALDDVLAAHDKAGIPIEDLADPEKLAEVDQKDLATINKAYDGFNKTGTQRTAIVKNVESACGVTLK